MMLIAAFVGNRKPLKLGKGRTGACCYCCVEGTVKSLAMQKKKVTGTG